MNRYDWDNILAILSFVGLVGFFIWLATGVWL